MKLSKVSIGLCVAMMACMLPACGKKDAGCKLDSECPQGQICRNMNCVVENAASEAQAGEAAKDEAKDQDAAKADAKPNGAREFTYEDLVDRKMTKLEDLGLDVDYVLTEKLFVRDNIKLEIGPGVTIDMQSSDAGISVEGDGMLVVKGTAEAPVIFKSTDSSPWYGVGFYTNRDNSLSHLQIIGSDCDDSVIVIGTDARVAMDHVTIDGSPHNGVQISDGAKLTKFTNNTIKNCKEYPIVLGSYENLAQIGEGNVYENNKQFIRIEPHYFNNVNETVIKKQPIPYLLADGINVGGESSTLKIEPGVEFVFEHDKVARISDSVQLKLEGTAENPVIMRGLNDEPNYWLGLSYESTRPSSINGLLIANAGKGEEAALRIRGEANLTISNLTFKPTDYICLEIGDNAKLINKGGLTFEKCGKGNIYDARIDGDDDKRIIAELPVTAE